MMNAKMTNEGNALIARIEGRLDSQSSPELERIINSSLDGITSLTLDFSDLLYVSSAGLRIVLSCKKKMNAVQGEMIILNPNELVMDVFDATGFADILDIRRSI